MIVSIGVSQGYFTIASNPHYQKLRDVFEQLVSKVKNEELTLHLHDLSLHVNQF